MNAHEPRPNRRLRDRAEYRFGLVLLLLLCNFVVLMTGTTDRWMRPMSVALSGATLLAALFAANIAPRLLRIASVCVGVAFLASLSLVWLGGSAADGVQGVLNAALVVIAPIAIASSVLRRRVVDAQTIMAALCVYVLFAMWWAFLFMAIGSFGLTPFFVQQSQPTSADYLYFSFITQLTVGYGDLTAASDLGRACAVLDALLGQLYLVTIVAVLVSRLVPGGTRPSVPTG